jgi:Domain of unknown function (DUF4351)
MSIAEQCVLEGRIEGRAELLLRLMTRRFGPMPDSYRQRVMDGSQEEHGAWADALLDAKTLDEVFVAPPSNNS